MPQNSPDPVLARETFRPELRRALRAGTAEKIRYGAYRDATADGPDHRVRAQALHRQLRADHVFSHETAAALWGCRSWRDPARVHIITGYRRSGHASRDVQWHLGAVPDELRSTAAGLPVTNLARTVVDCALTMHPLEGLVVADSALRLDSALRAEAHRILADVRRRNGRVRARWVLDHADRGAHSPWETWIRYVCLRAGMPRPQTQAPVVTPQREYHCDLGWPEHGVYVEFDGRMKYRTDGARELLREKERFDQIRAVGINPVRVLAVSPSRVHEVVRAISGRFPDGVSAGFRVNPRLPPPL